MIGDHSNLFVAPPFRRLTDVEIGPFRHAQTCQVVDAMNGKGALDSKIKPLVLANGPLVGTALTVECHSGDLFGVLAAMPHVKTGDVLVVSAGGNQQAAIMGDLVALALKGKGAAGFVTDGFVRDIAGLRGAELPVFAAGLVPHSGTKRGPGGVGGLIVCGGVSISSGDLVIADEDGVVIVPRGQVQLAADNLAAVMIAEKKAAAAIGADPNFFDLFATVGELGGAKS